MQNPYQHITSSGSFQHYNPRTAILSYLRQTSLKKKKNQPHRLWFISYSLLSQQQFAFCSLPENPRPPLCTRPPKGQWRILCVFVWPRPLCYVSSCEAPSFLLETQAFVSGTLLSLLSPPQCFPSFPGSCFSAGFFSVGPPKVLTRAHRPSHSPHIFILKSVIQQRALFK